MKGCTCRSHDKPIKGCTLFGTSRVRLWGSLSTAHTQHNSEVLLWAISWQHDHICSNVEPMPISCKRADKLPSSWAATSTPPNSSCASNQRGSICTSTALHSVCIQQTGWQGMCMYLSSTGMHAMLLGLSPGSLPNTPRAEQAASACRKHHAALHPHTRTACYPSRQTTPQLCAHWFPVAMHGKHRQCRWDSQSTDGKIKSSDRPTTSACID